MIAKLTAIFFFLLPLSFALSVYAGFDVHITRIAVLMIFFIYIAHSLWRNHIPIPRGSVAYLSLALLGLLSASFFLSDVPTWSARKVFYIWTFAPLFIIIASLLTMGKLRERLLIKAIVGGGCIAASIALAQFGAQFIVGRDTVEALWLSITPFFLGGTFSQSVAGFNSWFVHLAGNDIFRAIGFFPDPHVFAFFTGMIMPFAYGLFIQTRRVRWAVAGTVILCASILSFSRGGEMGILAGGLCALILGGPHLKRRAKYMIMIMLACGMLLAIAPQNPISGRFISSFDTGDTSNTSRIEIWREALGIWSKSPIFGVGLGAYPYAVDPSAGYRTPIYAHNIFLDVAVEIGVVGLMLFLALLIRIVHIFFRRKSVLSYCAIISVSIFVTHGMFDTPFFSVHVFPLILFLVALASYYEQSTMVRATEKMSGNAR